MRKGRRYAYELLDPATSRMNQIHGDGSNAAECQRESCLSLAAFHIQRDFDGRGQAPTSTGSSGQDAAILPQAYGYWTPARQRRVTAVTWFTKPALHTGSPRRFDCQMLGRAT
jgi:hypothetical protein